MDISKCSLAVDKTSHHCFIPMKVTYINTFLHVPRALNKENVVASILFCY